MTALLRLRREGTGNHRTTGGVHVELMDTREQHWMPSVQWLSIFDSDSTELFGLLRDIARRECGSFAKEEVFHVLGDELLRFFLPRHQPVLVEDHLHAILPELPCLRRDVFVDALAEFAGPR